MKGLVGYHNEDPGIHAYGTETASKSKMASENPIHWNRGRRRLWLVTLLVGCTMIYASRQTVPVTVTALADEYQWTKSQTGIVLSAFFWGYTASQIPAGLLSDKYGGATVLCRGTLGWATLTALFPVSLHLLTNKEHVLAAAFIVRGATGLAQGFHYSCITSLFARRVSKIDRSFSYAFATSGSQFGSLLAGGAGSLLLENYGWPSVFYFVGFTSLAWLALVWAWLLGGEEATWKKEQAKNTSGFSKTSTDVPWGELLRKPAFWSIIICHFTSNNTFYILLSWLPTYFKETFPGNKGWIFNVVPWLMAIPAKWCGGLIADRLITAGYSTVTVRKSIETFSAWLTSICLLIVANSPSYHVALACMALALAGMAFHTSSVIVNPQDIAPRYAGSVYGVMNAAGSLPGLLGVYLVGYVLDTTQSWAVVFISSAVISLIGWAVFLLFGEGKPVVS